MANINNLKPIQQLGAFTRFCCSIGALPSSYLASLTYEEQLLWLCDYLQNTVIPTINNNAGAVEELQQLYVTLKNYVDNYFENLDVQSEINNKLDEMAENGELQAIIESFLKLNTSATFKNVADMQASSNLINGSFVQTFGFYDFQDGGGNRYIVRNITNNDVVDNMTILPLKNPNLIAQIVFNSKDLNIMQLGAHRDGVTNNKTIIDKAISLFANGGHIIFPNGEFATSGYHNIDPANEITVEGNGQDNTEIIFTSNDGYCFSVLNNNNHLMIPVTFKNFGITSTNTTAHIIAFRLSDRWGCRIENILSYGFQSGCFCQLYNNIRWTEGTIIRNCMIRQALHGIECSRNPNISTNTPSFFNTKIDNVNMDINEGNGTFICLLYGTQALPITAYSWDIKATCWFGSIGGNKTVIDCGDYSYLSGTYNIKVDGFGGNFTGQDCYIIKQRPNGFTNLRGTLDWQQSLNTLPSSMTFNQIINLTTPSAEGPLRQPIARLQGSSIRFGGTLNSTNSNSVIYQSQVLPARSKFKITLNYDGNGIESAVYLVQISNGNFSVDVADLSVRSTEAPFLVVRPYNNNPPLTYHKNEGQRFEIYAKTIPNNATYNVEIEML